MNCLLMSCSLVEWAYKFGLFKSCMKTETDDDETCYTHVSKDDEPQIPPVENHQQSLPYHLSYFVNGTMQVKEKFASFEKVQERIKELSAQKKIENYCINYD